MGEIIDLHVGQDHLQRLIRRYAMKRGWWFFLLSSATRKSLSDLWHEYVDQTAVDVDEADMPEEDDE